MEEALLEAVVLPPLSGPFGESFVANERSKGLGSKSKEVFSWRLVIADKTIPKRRKNVGPRAPTPATVQNTYVTRHMAIAHGGFHDGGLQGVYMFIENGRKLRHQAFGFVTCFGIARFCVTKIRRLWRVPDKTARAPPPDTTFCAFRRLVASAGTSDTLLTDVTAAAKPRLWITAISEQWNSQNGHKLPWRTKTGVTKRPKSNMAILIGNSDTRLSQA